MCDFEKALLNMKLCGFDHAKIPAVEAKNGLCGIFPARDDYAVAHKAIGVRSSRAGKAAQRARKVRTSSEKREEKCEKMASGSGKAEIENGAISKGHLQNSRELWAVRRGVGQVAIQRGHSARIENTG